jgi:integrase
VKTVGWHTFRHTVATWLLANGESIKTSQELMRHASPSMTLGTYAQAITKDKREAQGRIGLLLGLEVGESDLATSA